ncbi:MAG: amidohydrolase family protein [Planctomycetes bacterium]|nr:amidohydrolase family protein [Planctomycetota bacterium]
MSIFEEILEHIEGLTIIDTHEHLSNESEWAGQQCDVLVEWLKHYFSSDLVSAGLPKKVLDETVRDSRKPLMERWAIVEPYWQAARNTGYARALDITAREIYGLAGVNGSTIEELNAKFVKRRADTAAGKSYYRHVLKDKGRIAVSITPRAAGEFSVDREFLRSVLRLEGLIDLHEAAQLEKLGAETNTRIHTLDDYESAVKVVLERALSEGAVGLKCLFAYRRPILFGKATREEAEAAFNGLFGIMPSSSTAGMPAASYLRPLEDYMMHRTLAFADERGMVMQVHTGIQAGNGNILANSNPELLTNLFLEYRNVTFDIFHISYPWHFTLAALAKSFANVTIDMCWAHIISPEASVRALAEYLDSVPANKISAFGGDYCFPDGVYGHQKIARQNVARTLALKVEEGTFDLDRAKEISTWLFVDNPKRIFNLDI